MSVMWSMKFFKADAEKVHDELQTLEEITPQNIVDYAKDENTELHKCFNWDDTYCANEYRKQTARKVVQFLVVKEDNPPEDREPIKIRVMQNTGRVYEPVQRIIQKEDEYKKLLERAYAELRAFKQRYKSLVELEEILALID